MSDTDKHTEGLLVEVEVTNIGERVGSEIVQVYARDVEASVERPPQELVGFEKIRLEPGERKTVSVAVKAEDLAFYDVSRHAWVIEPGDFKLLVGKSSRDIQGDAELSYG